VCSLVSNLHVHNIIRWIITITIYKFRSHPGRKSRAFGRLYSYIFLYYILFFIVVLFIYSRIRTVFTYTVYIPFDHGLYARAIGLSIMAIYKTRKHLHFQNKQYTIYRYTSKTYTQVYNLLIFLHQFKRFFLYIQSAASSKQ